MSALRYRQQIEHIGKEQPLLLPCEPQQPPPLSPNSSAPAPPPPVPAPALLTRHGPVAWAPSPAPLRSPRPGPSPAPVTRVRSVMAYISPSIPSVIPHRLAHLDLRGAGVQHKG